MAHYEILHVDGFVQTSIEGSLDFAGTAALLRQVAEEASVKGRHLMLDLREAEASGLSYSDVYRLVRMLSEHPRVFHNRIALLDTFRDGFEKVQFFQASATDQGFEVRAFLDEAAAVLWLEATEPVA